MSVEGAVATGWDGVAEALEHTVDDDGGAGAAVCVYVDGAPVLDIWAGDVGDSDGRLWARETVACIFSATKGVAAICAHMLVEQGLLDLDAAVASYWPEFRANGKSDLKLRWVLTHQAGLPLLDPDFNLDDVAAVDPVLRAIESQRPLWEPGTHHGYHAMTFGFVLGEIVRRVTGRTLGRYFRDEVVRPLRLNAWIGLPEDTVVDLASLEAADSENPDLELLLRADPDGPLAQFARTLTLGSAFPLALVASGEGGDYNDRRVLALELPAADMVSDARSLARIYAATVSEVDGVRLLNDATAAVCLPVQTRDTQVFGSPVDPDTPRTLDFSLGFLKRPLLGDGCFGHPGASGALGFADVTRRLSFGYVPRLMRPEGEDTRAQKLLAAVREALA